MSRKGYALAKRVACLRHLFQKNVPRHWVFVAAKEESNPSETRVQIDNSSIELQVQTSHNQKRVLYSLTRCQAIMTTILHLFVRIEDDTLFVVCFMTCFNFYDVTFMKLGNKLKDFIKISPCGTSETNYFNICFYSYTSTWWIGGALGEIPFRIRYRLTIEDYASTAE